MDLSVRECIEQAKRNVVDCIYSSARIEGIAVTFPETQQIYDGITVPGMSVTDVVKINNMKHAWEFVFDSIEYPLDLLYLRQLNQLINAGLMMDAGQVRGYDVQIGGTSWRPEIPDMEKIWEALGQLMKIGDVADRAVSVMLYVMRSQIFSDGNKRVAQMAANQILIQNGYGYLKLPIDRMNEFYEKLVTFYETNNDTDIKKFVLDNAIIQRQIRQYPEQPRLSMDMFKRPKETQASWTDEEMEF